MQNSVVLDQTDDTLAGQDREGAALGALDAVAAVVVQLVHAGGADGVTTHQVSGAAGLLVVTVFTDRAFHRAADRHLDGSGRRRREGKEGRQGRQDNKLMIYLRV